MRSFLVAILLCAAPLHAHGDDPRFHVELPLSSGQVTRSLALGRTLGLRAPPSSGVEKVGDRTCIVGGLLGFDVADEFAFDIDERVELDLLIDTESSPERFVVAHDRAGGTQSTQEVEIPARGSRLQRVHVTLDRARFANRGSFGTDLGIAAVWGEGPLAICGIEIVRSHTTPAPAAAGALSLRFVDIATLAPTEVRVGLYDADGRAPLPSDSALLVEHFYEPVRMLPVRTGSLWPVENRWVFYADGSYDAELPAGSYRIVASKGLEYRIASREIEIRPGESLEVELALERWVDLPKSGWLSGDPHVHIERRAEENAAILAQMAAEDLHVSNLLRIGNVKRTWFDQYAFGMEGRYQEGGRTLVSGQEDPTTGHRGHTISLNLKRPVRDLDRYFLYHELFDEVHRQGGLSGYAHLSAGWFHIMRGLALDVPHGQVDFVEVLQIGLCDLEVWYPFLNLGYQLVPSAGSDFPYVDLPGTVRNYVDVGENATAQAWFDGLEAGRTFVTNGPLLELDINGRGMGESLDVEAGTPIRVRASARMNPDWDRLARVELVVHGEVVATVTSEGGAELLELAHDLVATGGMWIALRTYGHYTERWNTVVAHSAPVYVTVAGGSFAKPGAAEEIVPLLLAQLDELESAAIEPRDDLMFWDTSAETLERWRAQRGLLESRIEATRELYRALLLESGAPVR